MKQTAVEWLISELMEKDLLLVFGNPSADNDAIKIIEQAKEMEKEQRMEAWCNGYDSYDEDISGDSPLEYYNKIFKTNEK